ncbi:MAG: hypothetical protein CMJ83_19350 [Planctomycetes bacterium]|nr:hypothetical protein [Planctomycetota bacterium]
MTVTVGISSLLVIGAMQLALRPVGWTTFIAIAATLASLSSIVSVVTGSSMVGGASAVIWTLCALGAWASLRTAQDLRQLYQAHPEVLEAVKLKRRSV